MKATNQFREAYKRGMNVIFTLFKAPKETQELISCALLVRNSKTLLTGGYGTGKTTLIGMLGKAFFDSGVGKVALSQEKTPFDIFYYLDIPSMMKGIEKVEPRPIVTKPLKFINEFSRANNVVQNEFLELFAEGEKSYRNETFKSPPYVCLLDMNPKDATSTELSRALLDRIDYSVDFLPVGVKDGFELTKAKYNSGQIDCLLDLVTPVMKYEDVQKLWGEVASVTIPDTWIFYLRLIAAMISNCVKVEKSTASQRYRLDCSNCEFKNEPCSYITDPPAERWVESTIKLAKAKAWLAGNAAVGLEDVVWGLQYTLPHRLVLKQEVFMGHSSEREWVSEYLRKALDIKKKIWKDGLKLAAEARKGDKDAREKLEKLAEKDLALKAFVRDCLR